jgi:AcrR family transcriptional regulator
MGRKAIERQRKENKEKTVEWIRVLFPYFQEHGLKGITMDLVAQVLNISKTTVYDYYQTKEQLLTDVVQHKIDEVKGFEDILTNDEKSFQERCYELMKFQADNISDTSNLFLTDLRDLFPEAFAMISNFLDYVTQVNQQFYQKGMEKGEFNNINPIIIATNDKLFFRTLSNPDFLSQNNLSIKEAFEQYAQMKFFGLIKKCG